jgi:hypothetical protein
VKGLIRQSCLTLIAACCCVFATSPGICHGGFPAAQGRGSLHGGYGRSAGESDSGRPPANPTGTSHTLLTADSTDALPTTGPAPYGVESPTPVPPYEDSSVPGGAGNQFPDPKGNDFPGGGPVTMGGGGMGTGTDSTLGGSGTGTGGMGRETTEPGAGDTRR